MDNLQYAVLQSDDYISKEYNVQFSNRVIRTTVTQCPTGIRRWIQALRPSLQRGSRIALMLKTAPLKRNSNIPKPVACAFLSGDSCLLVQFDKKKKKNVPDVIIQFLLDYYVFVGMDMRNAMDMLLEGLVLSKLEGEPTFLDLNTVVANHYGKHVLFGADLYHLYCEVFKKAPPAYRRTEETDWDCLNFCDTLVAAITREAALVCDIIENLNVPVPVYVKTED